MRGTGGEVRAVCVGGGWGGGGGGGAEANLSPTGEAGEEDTEKGGEGA